LSKDYEPSSELRLLKRVGIEKGLYNMWERECYEVYYRHFYVMWERARDGGRFKWMGVGLSNNCWDDISKQQH
jgi:hypothetical protein